MNEFKLIVAGGRDFTHAPMLAKSIINLVEEMPEDIKVSIVSGMARGADRLGYEFAKKNGITCYEFPADWDRYGKVAGYKRNEAMAEFSDGVIAFWDGKSKGTQHMIETMHYLGKSVHIVRY